ncbi:MAG: helix-turn-helix transcriptional regulator [Kutzneria sp.]|nr:helix-turn-helix transcriptional regulator [Kutzneria sp.]
MNHGEGFADALREWRARRRLSQLELALHAGTTQRHVSFMETGRSLPGRAMVVRLAESLGLPLRERNGLLLTAGYAPSYPETRLDDPTLAPILGALQHLLDGHRPYPALVIDRYGDLVAANDALDLLTEGVAPDLLEPPMNILRVALHPRGIATRIVNFHDWAQHVLERPRQELARGPDERLESLLAELVSYLPQRCDPAPNHLGFAVPMRLRSSLGELRLITAITAFVTAVDVTISELKLETFLPADSETAAALTRAAAR